MRFERSAPVSSEYRHPQIYAFRMPILRKNGHPDADIYVNIGMDTETEIIQPETLPGSYNQ